MRRSRRPEEGLTVIEMSLVLSLILAVSMMMLVHMVQHVTLLARASQTRFLAQEAPSIGLLLARTIGRSENFRIYPTRNAAENLSGAVISGRAVRLLFRSATGAPRWMIISFEAVSGTLGLYVFRGTQNNPSTPQDPAAVTWPGKPDWTISTWPLRDVRFDADSGILLATLTGASNEQITYAAERH